MLLGKTTPSVPFRLGKYMLAVYAHSVYRLEKYSVGEFRLKMRLAGIE